MALGTFVAALCAAASPAASSISAQAAVQA
jgi:hypothetical protein